MSLVYNFSLDVFQAVPKDMNSSELAEFIQKSYQNNKEDYKNEYLQSLDAIIYLYTGIYLYETINKQIQVDDQQKTGIKNVEKQASEPIVEEDGTLEPVKTGLTTDEEYEKLLGYE